MLRRICRKPVFLRLSSNFNGPGLGDFIQGDVEEKTWSEYKVRLTPCHPKNPPWLNLGSRLSWFNKSREINHILSRIREPQIYFNKIIQGKLKRELGDKRLRLPPWLKGKNNNHLFAII